MSDIPTGWKLVPIEPTQEMIEAGRMARMNIQGGYGGLGGWEAMLAAAPTPPVSSLEGWEEAYTALSEEQQVAIQEAADKEDIPLIVAIKMALRGQPMPMRNETRIAELEFELKAAKAELDIANGEIERLKGGIPLAALKRRLPPLSEELYEYYPAMSAQDHERHVKEYVLAALSAAKEGK